MTVLVELTIIYFREHKLVEDITKKQIPNIDIL